MPDEIGASPRCLKTKHIKFFYRGSKKKSLSTAPTDSVAEKKDPETIASPPAEEEKALERPASEEVIERTVTLKTQISKKTTRLFNRDELVKKVQHDKGQEELKAQAAAEEAQKESEYSAQGETIDLTKRAEALNAVWAAYLDNLKTQEKDNLTSLLSHARRIEGNQIILELANPVQAVMLNEIKSDLALFIKSELSLNGQLVIKGEVIEQEDSQHTKLYTDTDKLQHLIKKNPALGNLKHKLGLDTDFQ